MKKIALFIKNDEKSLLCAKRFTEKTNSVTFFAPDEQSLIPDAVVCFGGDGTVLRSADYALKYNVPIISVNTGSLGFLSSFDSSNIDEFCSKIDNNSVEFDDFPLSCARLQKNSATLNVSDVLFLNDLTVQRKVCENTRSEAVSIEVFANGLLCRSFVGDGVIVSTALGSTAYSLSAGGAIIAPGVNGIIITPICPHGSSGCPIVLPDNTEITLKLGKRCNDCVVFTDGSFDDVLTLDDKITITPSDKILRIARGKYDYFAKLNDKILKRGD